MIGFHVYEDDILITTRGTIGKISRIPHIHKPGILHPCIIRFRIDDSLYDYRLLKLIFNQSDFVTEQILYKSNATTIEAVSYTHLYIEDELCGKRFRISPKSFYQVNPVQTEILYGKALEYAGLTGKETVVDAYCGTGTIGMIASDKAGKMCIRDSCC